MQEAYVFQTTLEGANLSEPDNKYAVENAH